MSRWAVAAFSALVVATVGAFFVSQHLKVSTPLIAGIGPAQPGSINPVAAPSCGGSSHGETRFSFYLLHKADSVDVYVIDGSGNIVRTLASGRHMRRGVRIPDGIFRWNGREDDHRVAPDGTYEIEVGLIHQGRTVTLGTATGPITITVKTKVPRPVVDRVVPQLIPARGHSVTILYSGNEQRGATIRLYRTDLGSPRLIKTFVTPWKGQRAVWDGKIHGRPAPAGTYLVGMEVTDAACNTGYFPPKLPPGAGSTAHAGVTVRYLAAQPPVDPVPAGTSATVRIESTQPSYRWSLVRFGASRPVASGADSASSLQVPLPAGPAGLYEIRLRAGSYSTAVPIVASSSSRPAQIMVVLPSLSWQGENPVDETGDGIPDTLSAGRPVVLARPLAHGLPPGYADEAGLLAGLDHSHLRYDLTTDLGLIDGVGPSLAGHATVVLAGPEQWLPISTATALRSYTQRGGHLLSFGIDSLQRGVTVRNGRALDPTGLRATDFLGAQRGRPVQYNREPFTVAADQLGILPGALPSYPGYQPLPSVAPTSQVLAAAGARPGQPSIIAYDLGRGRVVQIAVAGYGTSAPARALTVRILKSF